MLSVAKDSVHAERAKSKAPSVLSEAKSKDALLMNGARVRLPVAFAGMQDPRLLPDTRHGQTLQLVRRR